MEEGEEMKEEIMHEKQLRIEEIEQKFAEVIDMLVENYSTHMYVLPLHHSC